MRVCVLGPPAAGKTSICSELAKQYKLHHIKVKDVIDEAMGRLEASAARADKGDEEEDDGKGENMRAASCAVVIAVSDSRSESGGRSSSSSCSCCSGSSGGSSGGSSVVIRCSNVVIKRKD